MSSFNSKPRKDLVNKKFGRLTVVSLNKIRSKKEKESYWNCVCECGIKKVVCGYLLKTGGTISCGCARKQRSFENRKIITLKNLDIFYDFENFINTTKEIDKSAEIELAWSAGFFDGEGCTTLTTSKQKNSNPHTSLRLSVAQVEISPLKRFLDALEIGTIRGPYKYGSNKQYHYQYNVSGSEVIKVVQKLWAYLSEVKRKQAIDNISKYNNYLNEVAERKK